MALIWYKPPHSEPRSCKWSVATACRLCWKPPVLWTKRASLQVQASSPVTPGQQSGVIKLIFWKYALPLSSRLRQELYGIRSTSSMYSMFFTLPDKLFSWAVISRYKDFGSGSWKLIHERWGERSCMKTRATIAACIHKLHIHGVRLAVDTGCFYLEDLNPLNSWQPLAKGKDPICRMHCSKSS